MLRMKRFLAVFLSLLILFGNLPAYATSSVGTAAKTEYLKTESKFFKGLEKDFKKSELGKLLQFTYGINGTYNSTVDLEIKVPDIKTRKYVIQENGTYKDRYEDGSIEAYVEGEKVATVNVVANDNMVSIQVPELYEKYLTVDTTDLLSLVQKFEESITEESIPLKGMIYNSDIVKALKLNKDEEKIIKNASKKYVKLLDGELLKNAYFKKENVETLTVNDANYKCNTVSYEISTKQLVDALEKIWTEFKNDTQLVKLIWSKIETIYNLMAQVDRTYQELPTKEQVVAVIDMLFNELAKTTTDDILVKSVLYHKDNNLIRRDINLTSYNEEVNLLSIYTIDNDVKDYYAIIIEDEKIEDFITKNSNETIHTIKTTRNYPVYLDTWQEGYSLEEVAVEIFTIKTTQLNPNHYITEFITQDSNINFSMEYIKNKASTKEYDIDMNFKVNQGEQNIEINTGLSYKKDIKLNKINTKNSEIILNQKSKEELTKLWEDNQQQILEKIQGKFGSAFYYEEIINATQGVMDRAQERADKATAAQIGKAVRIWYVDYTTDLYLNSYLTENNSLSSTRWIKVSDLCGIDNYVYISTTSKGEEYYVGLIPDGRIAVSVSQFGIDLPELSTVTDISEEIEGSKILYVE